MIVLNIRTLKKGGGFAAREPEGVLENPLGSCILTGVTPLQRKKRARARERKGG